MRKKLKVALATLTIGMLSGFGLTSASAAEGNIDPNAEHSFTIHKYAQDDDYRDVQPNGDGRELSKFEGTPLEGVTFKIREIKVSNGQEISPYDAASWDLLTPYLRGLNEFSPEKSAAKFGYESELSTDSSGIARFKELPKGFYYVEEISAGPNQVLNLMKPFLVAVPMPDSKNIGDWLYHVHAYPKNVIGGSVKTVDDSTAYGLGDIVKWAISTQIPESGEGFDRFDIEDTLPSEVSYSEHSVELLDSDRKSIAFASPEDYRVDVAGTSVKLILSAAGLTKLESYEGGTIRLNISTRVQSVGSGDIINNAVVYQNDLTTNVTAATYWGTVDIVKYQTGTKKLLDGAEFEVYRTKDGAIKRADSDRIAVNEQTKFVVERDGRVNIPGLKVGQYFVVETKAPAGYIASTEAHVLEVTRGGRTTLAIENSQQPFGTLPPLGGVGLVLSVVIGLAALGGASALALSERRRRQEARAA